jgi:hypothetical protein
MITAGGNNRYFPSKEVCILSRVRGFQNDTIIDLQQDSIRAVTYCAISVFCQFTVVDSLHPKIVDFETEKGLKRRL